MPTEKRIDRKTFLTTGVAACAAMTLGACSGESDTGGTDETGGASTGGTGLGGASTGGTATGGTGTGGTGTGGGVTGGAGLGGSATGGAGAGGRAVGGAGTSGSSGSSGADSGGASGGGTGGSGGSGGSGGGTLTCTTETSNGTHSHPLVVPPSDVERGFSDGPYILEDGGTGHTHTVELTAYEFLYLQGGTPVTMVSSETEMHTHDCVITCVNG